MNTFTAIDFETARGKRWSICRVGLVRVENGMITDELSILVQPPNNFYWEWFTDIHGITPEITKNEPAFDHIWHLVEPFIKNQLVIAHNGFCSDFDVLAKTLEYYGLHVPEYEKHCNYGIYNDNLFSLCPRFQIALYRHEALSDARACTELFLLHLTKTENND